MVAGGLDVLKPLFEIVHERLHHGKKTFTRPGGDQFARQPCKQTGAQFLLQLAQMLVDRRWGQVQDSGGRGNARLLIDVIENFKSIEIRKHKFNCIHKLNQLI